MFFKSDDRRILSKKSGRLYNSVYSSKPTDYLLDFDYFLFFIAIAISVIGLVFLSSASATAYKDGGVLAMRVQIIGFVGGIIVSLLLMIFDYNLLKKISIPFYLINIVLMLAVYTPLGIEENGSRAWLNLKVTTYQPSELMKVATILLVAIELEKAAEDEFNIKSAIKITLAYLMPLGLILLQKDIGQAMVLTFAFLVMIFVGSAKWWYQLGVYVLGGIAIPFVWKFYMNDARRGRLLAFIDPDKYSDWSLQLRRSEMAIGSGRLVGQGVGEGAMNNGKKILVKLSDSIFAVIGEEGGFIMTVIVMILFAALLIRMCFVGARAKDMFGKCVAVGICAMFAFNIYENIGMNIGLMPITGVPLPFISKGGSSMLTSFMSIGLMLSISIRRKRDFFE